MIHEDIVSCTACEATITHIICGSVPSIADDPDYYLCENCGGEPEDDESVWTEEDIRRITPLTDEQLNRATCPYTSAEPGTTGENAEPCGQIAEPGSSFCAGHQ